jgi:hypothetical protein
VHVVPSADGEVLVVGDCEQDIRKSLHTGPGGGAGSTGAFWPPTC